MQIWFVLDNTKENESFATIQLAPDTLDLGYTECSNLVRELADMEVNKVADMVADMEVDKMADMVYNMGENKLAHMSCSNMITGVG